MRLNSSLVGLISILVIAGCSVQQDNPDFEYPPSAAVNSNQWPELVNTEQLAARAAPPNEADKRAIASVEARADALRRRAQGTPSTTGTTSRRADALRRRALNTQTSGISADRIRRLRERAEALQNATF